MNNASNSSNFNLGNTSSCSSKIIYDDTLINNMSNTTSQLFHKYDEPVNISSSYPKMQITNEQFKGDNNMISKIEIKGKLKNVVIVYFEDGDIQKAVCLPEDMKSFDLSMAITICIAKHACKGSSKLYKIIRNSIKAYTKIKSDEALKEKQQIDAKNKEKQKIKKRQEYLENKKKKESEQRIEEMKEAYLRATKESSLKFKF